MAWHDRLRQQMQSRRDQNLWRTREVVSTPQGRLVTVDGRTLLNFCSNNYLGLAGHPKIAQAGFAAMEAWGSGSGASHLVCGHMEIHDQLEQRLATWVGAEKAILFSTGYMANLALPQTFLSREGLLLQDKLNHASMIDAGKLSHAKSKRYPHLDFQTAEKWLIESDSDSKMLMTDGLFSMDGDQAPVQELAEICADQETLLVVDDAHGLGVLGDRGGGCLQAASVRPQGHVLLMGTLGKALGLFGAFVAGDAELIDAIGQFARTYIYTTALPPVVAGMGLAAVALVEQESWRRKKLFTNVDRFRKNAHHAGLPISESNSPIQPLIVGDSDAAMRLSEYLRREKIWVTPIRPPTVPVGTSRLRITLSADHEPEDIDRLIGVIKQGMAR